MDDLRKLQGLINRHVFIENNMGRPELEGYSSNEMHKILQFIFKKNCPVRLNSLSDADYKKIPLLNQIKYLLSIIEEHKQLKLTAAG